MYVRVLLHNQTNNRIRIRFITTTNTIGVRAIVRVIMIILIMSIIMSRSVPLCVLPLWL